MKYWTKKQNNRSQDIMNVTVGIYVGICSLLIAITPLVSNVPFTILTSASILVALISILMVFSISFHLPSHLSAFLNANIFCILWLLMGILFYFGYDFTLVRLLPQYLWEPIGKVTGILNICLAIGYLIFFNISILRIKRD